MLGLYAIVDATTVQQRSLPIVEVARAIAEARPAALQLRAKGMGPGDVLDLLRAIHPFCRALGVPLFANDRPDLAALSGCEGLHLGQDDLPIDVARRIAPHLRIGVSTHTLEQVEAAVSARPDYVAYGPVWGTRSKANPGPLVGLDGLSAARQRCPVPLVAIGGIDLMNASAVGRVSHLGAAIAALLPDEVDQGDLSPITERTRELHARLRSTSDPEP